MSALTETAATPLRRSLLYGLLALVVFVVSAILVARWIAETRGALSTDDAYVDAEQRVVTSRISGRVEEVLVALHARVSKGDVLVRLDERDAKARLEQAEATTGVQRAALAAATADMRYASEQTVDGTRAARGDEDVAREHVATVRAQESAALAVVNADLAAEEQARAQARRARAEFPAVQAAERRASAERASAESLYRQGFTPRNTTYDAEAADASAHADVLRARESVATADSTVVAAAAKTAQDRAAAAAAATARLEAEAAVRAAGGRTALSDAPDRVRSQKAHVEQLRAALEGAQRDEELAHRQLLDCEVRAPADGWIATRSVNEGETVAPSDTLFVLVPARGLYVTANFKETQVGAMRLGQPATIRVDAFGGATVTGHLDAIGASTLNMTSVVPVAPSNTFVKVVQRMPVRIALDRVPPAVVLRPGMSVEVSVRR